MDYEQSHEAQRNQLGSLKMQEKLANIQDDPACVNDNRTRAGHITKTKLDHAPAATADGEQLLSGLTDGDRNRCVSVKSRNYLENKGLKVYEGRRGLREMYEHEGDWEDEEDDDDWEPKAFVQPRAQWSCTNCILPNSDEDFFCRFCREHRKSAILRHGHLAPYDMPEEVVESDSEHKKELPHQGEVEAIANWSSSLILSPETTGHTAIGFDERMLLHAEVEKKSLPHPERPDRLRSIMGGLAASGLLAGRCIVIPAREATRGELQAVHTDNHLDAVEATAANDSSHFSSDTYANRHTALAARIAAGICIDLVSAIMKGQASNGFALVRPPGHHAESVTVMGFCYHNNAAVAAKAAQSMGAKRVLILDWDVHHGNGTQEIFESDASVLYISLHRHEGGRFYPGSGAAVEVGYNKGEGFSVNIPWSRGGVGDEDYLFAFEQIVMPIASQFNPDITIVSAGFDAAKGDPLGGCKVTPSGYSQMTHMLRSLANGRMLVVLEGGYNLRSISASAAAVIKVLLGEAPELAPGGYQPSDAGLAAVLEVCQIHGRYWKFPDLLLRLSSEYADAKQKGKQGGKQVTGGPVWWKWGRKRIVYEHWFA